MPRLFARRAVTRAAAPKPGQALVELAMVGIILLTTALGTIEFGRAFHAYLAVTHASRDGARTGMNLAKTDGDITAAATSASSVTLSGVGINRGLLGVEVTASHSFTTTVPLVAQLWGGGALAISRSSTARYDGTFS